MRKTTTKLAALLTCLALFFSLMSPPRAQALNDEWTIAIAVVVGVTVFVGAVIVGTMLTRDESKLALVELPPPPEQDDSTVAFGLDCAMPDGRPALVCW